jgi:hypothetical protein
MLAWNRSRRLTVDQNEFARSCTLLESTVHGFGEHESSLDLVKLKKSRRDAHGVELQVLFDRPLLTAFADRNN